MKLESSLNFNVNIKLPNGKEVLYLNTYEICQGCPEVGKLSIDGNIIKKEIFDGPLLYNNGFYLAKINTSTLEMILISEMNQIINLIEIENSTIYFYNSLEQNEIHEIPFKD